MSASTANGDDGHRATGLHPYITLEQAQVNLTDPETDGSNVLNRIYEASTLP